MKAIGNVWFSLRYVVCGNFLPFGYYDLYFPAQATNNYYIRWDA
jgi:hypothetical protein